MTGTDRFEDFQPGFLDMKLSIIIPCYNESRNIREVIKRVNSIPISDREVIVVDDGSRDGTREILNEESFPGVDKIVYHRENRGKGAAVRSGFEASSGDVLVIQDADLEYDPQELPLLLALIIEGRADVVYGSRFIPGKHFSAVSFRQVAANRFLTWLSNQLTGTRLTDMETCYKMFRREVLDSMELEENRFGIEPELTAKIARAGHRIIEVGISYSGRTGKQGKKIGWRDGISALRALFKYTIFHR